MSNDPGLEDGAVPDLKVIDTDINMTSGEVNASTLLDFFNQLSSKSSASLETIAIKEQNPFPYHLMFKQPYCFYKLLLYLKFMNRSHKPQKNLFFKWSDH